MDEERPKPWTEMPLAERVVERERRVHEDELAERREAVARAEADAILSEHERPRSRADCVGEQRPCPWVGCRHHLYLDVNPSTGAIKLNFPDLEPWELRHSCVLDLAARDGMTLTEVGAVLNVTRERVRQIEANGQRVLRSGKRRLG